jgi:histidinol-phosphate aminotransferase
MNFWNSNLKKAAEYIPGEQPNSFDSIIKLNTNENPFPPSKKVLEELKNACNDNLRRYPNPTASEVRGIFASANRLHPDNVFVANGSDEIFTLLFRGFIEPNGLAGFPYPSYALYYSLAELNGIAYEKINLEDDFSINFAQFLKKKYDLIIIANPNNPTGTYTEPKYIEAFLKKYTGLLVVDEAYIDFYGGSSIDLVSRYDNIVVTRSFSKSYSLAGLRIGIAAAHKDIIRGFIKIKDSYNVDMLAAAGAKAALLDDRSFRYNMEMLRNNKEYLEERLAGIGFEITPSKANFIFVKHPDFSAEDIYEKLKAENILVRHYQGPLQENYVRITVGSMLEIKSLCQKLTAIMGS